MAILPPPSSPNELCHRSTSVLATRDRIAPGAVPVSLREHPIWGHFVTHEGSAYERDCKVADSLRAQVSLPAALFERKKDELPEAYSPVKFRMIDANEALNGFKYDKIGGSTVPLAMVVACVVEQPPYKVEPAATSGKCTEHKLRRQKGYANLRAESAV
ncbi:hypothetical protein KCU67_g12447, partial [Aureobasidium melanogenum]